MDSKVDTIIVDLDGTIVKHQKTIYLGQFYSKEDAALAYNEGAKKYHGQYAQLNEVI
jgi:hypothetical protein